MLALLRISSLLLFIISRMSVPICNSFYARQGNISKNNHLLEGYPSFALACANLLEPKGSTLELLKFAFNAENFAHSLSCFILRHFVAIRF